MLGVEVNLTNNTILGLQVGTYIDKPADSVSLKVAFATLADGTGYPSQVTLDATKQNVRVVTQNTGYRPVQQSEPAAHNSEPINRTNHRGVTP